MVCVILAIIVEFNLRCDHCGVKPKQVSLYLRIFIIFPVSCVYIVQYFKFITTMHSGKYSFAYARVLGGIGGLFIRLAFSLNLFNQTDLGTCLYILYVWSFFGGVFLWLFILNKIVYLHCFQFWIAYLDIYPKETNTTKGRIELVCLLNSFK